MNVILENLYVSRELYSSLFHSVCTRYKLTPAELLVLMFLANNTEYDTARDIVNKMKITKSHVSVSVRALEERGYLKGCYEGRDRRTIHLQLCEAASDILNDARRVQKQFLSVLGQGFTEEELEKFRGYLQRETDNINRYLQQSASVKAEA